MPIEAMIQNAVTAGSKETESSSILSCETQEVLVTREVTQYHKNTKQRPRKRQGGEENNISM
jgi:hypothetical protein